MDKQTNRKEAGSRYTARLVVLEEPLVVAELQDLARRSGLSVASLVRYAIRNGESVGQVAEAIRGRRRSVTTSGGIK
jgi:hypothetical protein